MAERLDRIEAILLNVTERLSETNATLDRVANQQERNTADIDALLGAISTTDVEVRSLSASVAALEVRATETDTRFNVLIQEMRADRRASQQAFQALLLQLAGLNGRVDSLEQAS
jgi:chromosome segregation ATPase